MVIIDYVLGKQKTTPTQNTQNNQASSSPISAEEDVKIKEWVNQTYSWQSEAYKKAAYKDAYDAVLERKQTNQKKVQDDVRRQVNANTASYKWDDKVKQQEAKLAKAEKAIYDAAEIIKEWQRANWVKVDENLTPKQTVDSFLLANNWKPYAEYVSKYLDNNINGRAWTNNVWLASKLGLDTGTTLGIDNRTLINAQDKLEAWLRWFGQWLVNLTQNTLWAWAEWLGSNLWAWVWEIWYALAEEFGWDTSEWSVWDKLKKAKGYSWSEAKDAANSHLGEKWGMLWEITSEDKWAYDIWEWLWETAAEVALTAPVGLWVWTTITKSALPKAAKRWLQWLNSFWEWIAFQWLEDATNWEISSAGKYAQTWLLSAATWWTANALGTLAKKTSSSLNKLKRLTLWPNERIENALLKKTTKEYDHIDSVNKAYSKDPNVWVTPYTEMSKTWSKAKKTIYDNRIKAWEDLQQVRQNLKYIEWKEYTRENVKDDLNAALRNLADESKYWQSAKELDQIPQFEIKDWKLTLSEDSMNELNSFKLEIKWVNDKGKEVNLWDEIMNLYNRVYGMWGKDNAANTHYFIEELKELYKKWWKWGNPNLMRETINSLWQIEKKFTKSLYASSRDELSKATKIADKAISLDESWDKLIWAMRWGNVEKVKESVKAYKWWPTLEQLFRDVKEATKWAVDMNNEVLAWAYNLSLHDVTKAKDLLNTFYPSKAWAIETLLQQISKPMREWVARDIVKSWTKTRDLWKDINTDRLNAAFVQIANIINANDNE